jgi:hypothetical protein
MLTGVATATRRVKKGEKIYPPAGRRNYQENKQLQGREHTLITILDELSWFPFDGGVRAGTGVRKAAVCWSKPLKLAWRGWQKARPGLRVTVSGTSGRRKTSTCRDALSGNP